MAGNVSYFSYIPLLHDRNGEIRRWRFINNRGENYDASSITTRALRLKNFDRFFLLHEAKRRKNWDRKFFRLGNASIAEIYGIYFSLTIHFYKKLIFPSEIYLFFRPLYIKAAILFWRGSKEVKGEQEKMYTHKERGSNDMVIFFILTRLRIIREKRVQYWKKKMPRDASSRLRSKNYHVSYFSGGKVLIFSNFSYTVWKIRNFSRLIDTRKKSAKFLFPRRRRWNEIQKFLKLQFGWRWLRPLQQYKCYFRLFGILWKMTSCGLNNEKK